MLKNKYNVQFIYWRYIQVSANLAATKYNLTVFYETWEFGIVSDFQVFREHFGLLVKQRNCTAVL